jgi:hypothetical protein
MNLEQLRSLTAKELKLIAKRVELLEKAEQIVSDFQKHVVLKMKDFDVTTGRFVIWKDSNNATYLRHSEPERAWVYECRFLHEIYNVVITTELIFSAMESNYKGLDHFTAYVNRLKRENSNEDQA